ncbi:hypothetical protein I4U23_003955 [Adineta vaga]|nr:hypothetical protein I4U23_003955 [Adineta vaga]
MSNEEIRSLFPTIDNSTWYHDSILNEKSNTTFPKILLPLFGFKKYLGELKDDENNPNIIGLVVSVENIQSNGICDSQNHKITVSENNTDVNVKSETSCYQASISSESSSILQLSMTINQIGFMEQFYSVPKLNMKYKYSFAVIYTDNVNKEVVNSCYSDGRIWEYVISSSLPSIFEEE